MLLWTEVDREDVFSIISANQTNFDLSFNPQHGTVLVFHNGIVVSKSDYTIKGRRLSINFPVEEGDYVSCRLVI